MRLGRAIKSNRAVPPTASGTNLQVPSFPRKRGFQQRSWSSILISRFLPWLNQSNMDSRFRGNDDYFLNLRPVLPT